MNPQLVIDFSKVQFATFYYKTRVFGYVRRTRPRYPTFHGHEIQDMEVYKAMVERKVLDDWIPHLRLSLSANRTLKFTGEQAKKLWKEYRSTQYRERK